MNHDITAAINKLAAIAEGHPEFQIWTVASLAYRLGLGVVGAWGDCP